MKQRLDRRERIHVARSLRDRIPRLGQTRLRGGAPHRGFTITESLVALVLLAAAAALMAQTLAGVAQQRRAADQQSLALQETANLMEQLFAMPYAELTPERTADLALSELARYQLPGARLDIAVTPSADEPAAKEVRVALRWLDRSGQYGVPLQLTAWRYQTERSGP
jgi:prepilin-type N-terminal cleavage/methylation domain-containing protein